MARHSIKKRWQQLGVWNPAWGKPTDELGGFGNGDGPNSWAHLSTELRSMGASASEMAGRFRTRLDTYVKYGEIYHAVRESTSVWILSLLAAIMLPLSLATGVLSMGTRFVELGSVLYDFVGVVVLLATMVIVFVAVIIGGMIVKRLSMRFLRAHLSSSVRVAVQGALKPSVLFATGLNALLFWIVVLTSFLVGMIKYQPRVENNWLRNRGLYRPICAALPTDRLSRRLGEAVRQPLPETKPEVDVFWQTCSAGSSDTD